jgi:negative regulator of flagellin synthesis FlgM
MKIDLNRSTQDTEAAKSTEAAQKVNEKRVAKKSDLPGAASTDRVEVSSDAKLMAAALKATTDVSPVRADVVEAMKQKLAAGEIGKDSGRLADRIIDDLLKE